MLEAAPVVRTSDIPPDADVIVISPQHSKIGGVRCVAMGVAYRRGESMLAGWVRQKMA